MEHRQSADEYYGLDKYRLVDLEAETEHMNGG